MKEDTCEFPLSEYDWKIVDCSRTLRVTRKKPKVEVEWRKESSFRLGAGWEYGWFAIVQFRVTGECGAVCVGVEGTQWTARINPRGSTSTYYSEVYGLNIHLDARDKWSEPVLLPESIYSRLDEITKALEDRANGGKG